MPVFDIIVELAIKLLPVIQQLFDAIIPIVVSILDAIMPILDVVIELAKVLLPVIVELFKSLMPILLPIFKIFEGIATYYAGIISWDFSKVGDGLKKIGEGLLNLIMGVFEGLINIAIGVFEGIVQSIPGFGDTTFERVDFEDVKLATGGIVEGPTRALIGEAGPEAVVPLNSDKSMNVFSKSLEDKLDRLIAAVEKLTSLYETTTAKYLKQNKKNLQDIMDYMETSEVTDGKDGNLAERLRIATTCGKTMMEFIQLEKIADLEKDKVRNKGGRQEGRKEL
jgi:hypothetical protein